MAQKTFKKFEKLNKFLRKHNATKEDLGVALTTNGFQLLSLDGEVVATIHRDLKGSTPKQTARNLASVNLTFGIPHDDGTPCVMEDKSEWEVVSIF